MSKLSLLKLRKLNHKGTIQINVDMGKYCTFKCGGKAKYFIQINTLENFIKVMFYFQEKKVDYFVLGAGSNLLVSDNGYNGVVIKLGGDLTQILMFKNNVLDCGAGCKLSQVYSYAKRKGLGGLEFSAGIPATIGGTIYMNAGAYDFEMSSIVEYVVAFINGKIEYFDKNNCEFSYRSSVFQKNKAIILRVGLKLYPADEAEISAKFIDTMKRRLASQPLDLPSAGSVFKRIDGIVVSKMLDECGVKGLTMGGAKVSEKHANFIVNFADATAQDIYDLIEIIKKRFYEKYKINLETEIKFLGEFDEVTW